MLLYFASPPLSYDRADADRQRGIINDAFAGAGWETPRLLELMETSPDLYFDSVSTIKMDSWSHGRIALLSDAGYCPSSLSGTGIDLRPQEYGESRSRTYRRPPRQWTSWSRRCAWRLGRATWWRSSSRCLAVDPADYRTGEAVVVSVRAAKAHEDLIQDNVVEYLDTVVGL